MLSVTQQMNHFLKTSKKKGDKKWLFIVTQDAIFFYLCYFLRNGSPGIHQCNKCLLTNMKYNTSSFSMALQLTFHTSFLHFSKPQSLSSKILERNPCLQTWKWFILVKLGKENLGEIMRIVWIDAPQCSRFSFLKKKEKKTLPKQMHLMNTLL